jgi:lipopolysaccharide export LptBFGC system permease protein LptF
VSSGLIWYKSKHYFAHFSFYDKETKKLNKLSIFYFSKNGLLNKIIRADSAGHFKDKTWRASKVVVYSSMEKKTFPKITHFDEFLLTLSEDPSDFENIESDVHELDVWELQKYIQKVDNLGINTSEFKILFYEKFSTSLICLIFSVLPLSGIFYPSRRGHSMGRSVIFLVVFTFAFWFMYSSTLTLGSNGKMTPFIGAFGIPLICLIYILIIIMKNRNLTE